MNMQVSYSAIMSACEMASLQIPIMHIDAMLRRELPMDNRLKVILKKVATGEIIEPMKDEPLRAAGAGRKPSEPKPVKPRPMVQTHRDAQLNRRPLTHFIQPILDILKDCDKPCSEIASELKKPPSTAQHILRKMQDLGFLDSQVMRGGIRQWFVAGYTTPKIDDFKRLSYVRRDAKAQGLKHYESIACEQCGTTKRITLSDKCVECSRVYGAEKYKREVESKKGIQS